jgi:hypothetical protein
MVTQGVPDVSKQDIPLTSPNAKSHPSKLADNKFGDPADVEAEKQATVEADAAMKGAGYLHFDKAVDSRTGSTTPSATPGVAPSTPVPEDLSHLGDDPESVTVAAGVEQPVVAVNEPIADEEHDKMVAARKAAEKLKSAKTEK